MNKKQKTISLAAAVLALIVSVGIFSGCARKVEAVEFYLTTGNKSELLRRQSDIEFVTESAMTKTVVSVDDKVKYNDLKGIGAAMTRASAYNIINSDYCDEIIQQLFSPSSGAGFTFVRIPAGSSDFSAPVAGGENYSYTYADMPKGETDFDLSSFSIELDREYLIPALKKAQAANPDITFMASPWSAPAWMKTTERLVGGSLKEDCEEVYAEYLAKFLLAYKAEGINIDYLSIQNEPMMSSVNYPCMRMDYTQATRIIKSLGKKLDKNKLKTLIMAWDHNYDSNDYALEILDDKDANKYVSGVAYHCYYGDITNLEQEAETLNTEFPQKEFYITEVTEYTGSRDFAANLSYSQRNVVTGPLNLGASAVAFWNLVLDENNGPVVAGGPTTCFGLITAYSDGSGYFKNSAYYSLAHISKFAPVIDGKRAVRIDSESDSPGIISVAFRRGDGKIAVTVFNVSDKFGDEVEIKYNGRYASFTLPQQSVATLVF